MSENFWLDIEPNLKAPLTRDHVKQREQSGRKFSYIEGWHVIAEANRIFGFGGWSSETVAINCVAERPREIGRDKKPGFGVSYTAKVRVEVMGVVREGVGSGHGIDVDLGLAHESAIKEAETDARKRALMTFGNPFGLALYDKEQANVCDKPHEPAEVAKVMAKALAEARTSDELQAWVDDADTKAALMKLSADDKAWVRQAYADHRTKLAEAEYQPQAAE